MQHWRRTMKKQQSNLTTSISSLGTGNISNNTTTAGNAYLNGITSGSIVTPAVYTTWSGTNIDSKPYIETSTLNSFFQYFTEKEVDEMFDKMLSRKLKVDENEFNIVYDQSAYIIQKYVQDNTCSEDFLMKYYNQKIINKATINMKHSRYIRTGEYPNLALLLEMEEK